MWTAGIEKVCILWAYRKTYACLTVSFWKINWYDLSYYPFTARYERDNLCRYVATDECTHCNTWYGGDGGQFQRLFEHCYPQPKPEYVHEVHAIAEFRHFCYNLWSFRTVYACEHKERACCENHTVDCTESPSYLYYRRGMKFTGYGLDVEWVNGQCSPGNH